VRWSVTTTYAYDALNRLTGKSYSNGDPSVSYFYDQTSYNGLTIANGKGRRTGMSDGSGQTAWSYDAMGRVLTERRTISSITKSISYAYNLDGSVASVTYPSGRVVSYDVTGAGLPTYAKDLANGINYALNTTYAPQGAVASALEGQSGSFGGITWSGSYSNRLLPTSFTATSTNGTALNLAFTYFANGNVSTVTNNRDTSRTQTFTYDNLNRIATGQSQADSGGNCWGQSFGYDRYANLTTIGITKCTAPMLDLSVNTQNRITNSGFSYDAAGNLTADGTYNYTWNGESQLSAVAGVTYIYDGDGQRVKKSSGTLYWYGGGAVPLAETDLSGNTTNEYIFFGGARIARRDASGNVYYYFGDHLGSSRTIANSAGAVCYEADFYPFGGERVITNTCGQNYKFAGMERDSETGNDHTWFRYYASNLGRWLGPDPVAGDITNPQSLNRYAYVLNNPVNFIDPLGLDECTWTPIDTGGGILTCPLGPGLPPSSSPSPSLQSPWDDPFRGGSGISGGGVGGKFAPRYRSTDNGPFIKPGGGLRRLIPSVCSGGGFGYAAANIALAPHVGIESVGLVAYDSEEGGAHGGILGLESGPTVTGVESLRTWNDWQTHTGAIVLGGGKFSAASKKFGKNVKTGTLDAGGFANWTGGQLSVGGYLGGKIFGGGGYLSLSWSGCKP
jgi:RHS repeat-associated protein